MNIFKAFALFVPMLATCGKRAFASEDSNPYPAIDVAENVTQPSHGNVSETQLSAGFHWDIDAPEYSIKKAAKVKRGRVLEKIMLTKKMKGTILRAHNRARSITKPSATNMLKMTWDNNLAATAVAYTRKCIYEHNPNPEHTRFSYVGENLFISMGLPFDASLLDHAVRAWDEEKSVYNYNTVTCRRGKICGHYTQVVWAESFKVGCGVTRCGSIDVRGRKWKDAILFGCNYGPGGNYRGEKPYKSGRACKKCPGGDKCSGKLCSNHIRDRIFFNPKMARWSPWSSWSQCAVTCGMGSQKRTRKCNTGVATDCNGYAAEIKHCVKGPCTTNQSSYRFDIVLGEDEELDMDSLLNLFRNGNSFHMKSR